MALTSDQQSRVLEIRASFASIKANLQAMMAQARAAEDAQGLNDCYASLADVMTAHAACARRLMMYDAAYGGGVVVSGPVR